MTVEGILALFKLRIYMGAHSDPTQTSRIEPSVNYVCGKLCFGFLVGFLNIAHVTYLSINYIYDLKIFLLCFSLVLFYSILS